MASERSGIVLRRIQTLWDEGRIGAWTDEQLLERFTATGSAGEAAFEAIILRHGPMVLGVCRRVLRDPNDVEDAFQATFLILARKPGAIRKGEVLGGWLCRVAYRVATRARALAARHRATEPRDRMAESAPTEELVERDDLIAAILGEVQLLPEKYRLPVQLCYLEGRTHDEAAAQLAWPVGTVRTRLAWARDRLRDRLSRRGLALSAACIDRSLLSLKASADVPAALVEATVAAAGGHAIGTGATTLAAGVMRAVLMNKLKVGLVLILVLGSLSGIALSFAGARVGKVGPTTASTEGRNDPRVAESQAGKQDDAATTGVGTVFFRVVAPGTRQPLARVTLKVWGDAKLVHQQVTDETGRVVIALPREKFDRLYVTARNEGFAPMKVDLRRADLPDLEVPRSYTLTMSRSSSIGGLVRDEDGRPIEGVTVSVYETSRRDRAREAIDLGDASARTDAQGRWHVDLIPEDFDVGDLQFGFSHPELLSVFDSSRFHPSPTPKELRSQSGVTVLYRGLTVTGRVLDRDGRPIAGALVRIGRRVFSEPVKTEADGGFRFRSAPAGETTLIVEAERHALESRPVRLGAGLPPLEIRLGPGRTIRGRVVDAQERPVAGAFVAVSHWSGGNGPETVTWHTQTAADGRFVWDGAPNDRVALAGFKQNYSVDTRVVEPADKEVVFKLTATTPLRIRGFVIDAETGRPIEMFRVVPIIQPSGIHMMDSAKTHHRGRYVFEDPPTAQPYSIRIEAQGHLPAESPSYPHDGGEQVFNARLSKGRWIEGAVQGPGGFPLAGAEVVLVTGNGVRIVGGRTYQREHHPHLLTGPDGRFAFSPPGVPYRVVAVHEQGYAEGSARAIDAGQGLKIEPWGRIEGTLRVGGKTLAHETIYAEVEEARRDPGESRIESMDQVQTDEHGHFVFDRLPPGDAEAFWMPERNGARTTPDRYYRPSFIAVQPGQTARLDIVLEGGPPLLGRIVVPGKKGRPLDSMRARAYLVSKSPEIPYPPELTEAERKEWLEQWQLTDAGRAYRRWRRSYGHSLEVREDGSFRVDEIQPGAYELHVQLSGIPKLVRQVVIPEAAGNQSDKAVDLGSLTVE
jgi:RNA polymerase sigma factor (sigma-70 family)